MKYKQIVFPILLFLSGLSRLLAQPVNDVPCNATELAINTFCSFSVFTNLDAGDSGLPDPGCSEYSGGDIWFRVTVPLSGSFEILTDTEADEQFPLNNGWMYRNGIALYEGTCEDLTLIECSEDTSIYNPRMKGASVSGQTPGEEIWIRIWEEENDDNGMVKICVTDPCPVKYNVSGGGSYCYGDTGVSISLCGSDPGIMYTLRMNDTIFLDTLAGVGDTLIWTPVLASGSYRIEAEDPENGCKTLMNDHADVEILPVPKLSFDINSVSCFGFNDGIISATITSGAVPYQLKWEGPEGYSSSLKNISNLIPGIYTFTVTDKNRCVTRSAGKTISEPELLEVTLENITHLTKYEADDGAINTGITGGTTPYSVIWSGTDDYLSYDEDPTGMTVGYYAVMIQDDHLCADSLSMIVVSVDEYSEEIFVPEGFSPNGDGANDLFVILGLENYPENEFLVFNLQGFEVFSAKNYENNWNGRPKKGAVLEGLLTEGTYFYILKYGETGIRKGVLYLNLE